MENNEKIKNHQKIVISAIIASVILPSFFGAVFGFMAGNLGQGRLNFDFFKKRQYQAGKSNTDEPVSTINIPDEESAVTAAV